MMSYLFLFSWFLNGNQWIEMFLHYPALQGYMAFKMSYYFLYTCVARRCEFTIEVINLKQLPQSFCGLGGLCAAYSPHICYNNLSDQCSNVTLRTHRWDLHTWLFANNEIRIFKVYSKDFKKEI